MTRLLPRCPRIKMIVEFWPAGLARSGYGTERLLAWLAWRGFRLYEVDEVELCVRRADPRRLLERYPVAGEGFTNSFCVKDLLSADGSFLVAAQLRNSLV